MLLDLHNLYCNALNHAFNAFDALERLELGRVIEIHVSGGRLEDGFWTDAHEGQVPVKVWELLEYTLPRCPNIVGVVFEILPDYVPRMGTEGICKELEMAGILWRRCNPPASGAS
jgi:hypothetical protein